MKRNNTLLLGQDKEALEILIALHCEAETPLVLDCTANKGTMWKGCGAECELIRSDINAENNPVDIKADFCHLPFANQSLDVIVFDPPHLPTNAASANSSKMWETRYGITSDSTMREGDNVSPMFEPFLAEAKRTLVTGGIVLAKIADLVHNHRYQWQHVDFIVAAKQAGMTPCDMMIKSDPKAGNLKSSKWQNVKHLRKNCCFWIVVRNSTKCEAKK